MIRFRLPIPLRFFLILLTILVMGFFFADLIALGYNIKAALPELHATRVCQQWHQYASEWFTTFLYAFLTSSLQVFFGVLFAVLICFYWARRRGRLNITSGLVYFTLLPYLVPIATLTLIAGRWARDHSLLHGIWAWGLLIIISVWQYFPFVYLLTFEQLLTLTPRSWIALESEGAGFWEAYRNLLWPKVFEILGFVFLLRFLWMYTKVDIIRYLLNDKGTPGRFIHVNIYGLCESGDLQPEAALRSIIMMVAIALLTIAMWVLSRRRSWLFRPFRKRSAKSSMVLFSPSPVPIPPVPQTIERHVLPQAFRRYFMGFLLLIIVSAPLIFLVLISVWPNDYIFGVEGDELRQAWKNILSSFFSSKIDNIESEIGRWLLQSIILAVVASFIYTFLMSMIAYALLREARLSRIGKDRFVKWISIIAYAVPVIAIALPLNKFFRRWECDTIWCNYGKLLIAQGFYLWPFCLWLAFRQLGSIRQRTELYALSEGASIWKILEIAVIPQFSRRAIAIFLLAFAISMNELIFATCLIHTEAYNTLPLGLVQKISELEGTSPGPLLVITTLTIFLGLALFLVMWWTSLPRTRSKNHD